MLEEGEVAVHFGYMKLDRTLYWINIGQLKYMVVWGHHNYQKVAFNHNCRTLKCQWSEVVFLLLCWLPGFRFAFYFISTGRIWVQVCRSKIINLALLSFKLKGKRKNFAQTQCSEFEPIGPTLTVTIAFASHYPPDIHMKREKTWTSKSTFL